MKNTGHMSVNTAVRRQPVVPTALRASPFTD